MRDRLHFETLRSVITSWRRRSDGDFCNTGKLRAYILHKGRIVRIPSPVDLGLGQSRYRGLRVNFSEAHMWYRMYEVDTILVLSVLGLSPDAIVVDPSRIHSVCAGL